MIDEKSFIKTPLQRLDIADNKVIWVKNETLQKSGAFKYRGPHHLLSQGKIKEELVAASTGNHAIGLSTAAKAFGYFARIFVPVSTPKTKVESIKAAGGKISFVEGDYEMALELAVKYSEDTGAFLVPSYDHPEIIKGNSEIFKEILNDLPTAPKRVFLPVGGGGILSAAISQLNTYPIEIIGAEYEPFTRVDAIISGEIEQIDKPIEPVPPSIEGISVRVLGKHPIKIIRKAKNFKVVQVTQIELEDATRLLWEKLEIRVELAAAAGLAAAIKTIDFSDSPNVCVVTGGNIDPDLHANIIAT